MQNWDKYLLIALVGIVLFILLKMNKVMALQTNIMVGMAVKLGVTQDMMVKQKEEEPAVKTNQEEEETEEENEDDIIVRIAQKIYNGKKLNTSDKEFYEKFKKDIDEEAEFFLVDDLKEISEAISNGEEISEDNASLYKEHYEKYAKDAKLVELTEDIKIKESEHKEVLELKSEEERKHLILTFFSDGVPKNIGTLAKMYGDKTGLVPSTGNTAKLLDKLLEEKKLMNQRILHQSRNKVFYGLPEWFDGKKFKKEYLKNIPK